jgi:hypothetical protein
LAIIGHWPSIPKRPVDSNLSPYAINQWLALSPAGQFNHSVSTVHPRKIRGRVLGPEDGAVQLQADARDIPSRVWFRFHTPEC